MRHFFLNTKAELLKCRKTAAYWITLAGGLFLHLMLMIAYIVRPAAHIEAQGANPWTWHIHNVWEISALFVMPLYVILVTSLVVQIEYRSNTWKQVYASPRSYADIFFSKFVVVQLLILSCFLLYNVMTLAVPYLVSFIHKGYKFNSTSIPWKSLFTLSGKLYLSILAMTSLQYWLSLRFRNYIAPLGIGLALLITGIVIHNWEYIHFYPYAYSMLSYFRLSKEPGVSNHELYSIVWFALVLMLGLLDTVKRKEHG